MYIIRNTGLLLLLAPFISLLIFILYPSAFAIGYDGVSLLGLLIVAPFFYVCCNLFGIIFSIIFLYRIKLVLVSAVMFIANMYLSMSLLPSLGICAAIVASFLLSLGIIAFDNIYMKRYFKKLLIMNDDIIFYMIRKIKISTIVFYLNKYKRKEPTLYNSLIAKFEKMKIEFLLEIKG
jgi:hypothetical protein